MPPKAKSSKTNSNTNNNTNTIKVNVTNSSPNKTMKKQSKSNWWIKTIIGSIIALLLSLFGYYFSNSIDKDNINSTRLDQILNPIEPNH